MAVIAPMHGAGSCLFGFLTLNRVTDCNRMGLTAVEAPLGGILRRSGRGLGFAFQM